MGFVQNAQQWWSNFTNGITSQRLTKDEIRQAENTIPPVDVEMATSEESLSKQIKIDQYTPDSLVNRKKFGIYDDMVWNDDEISGSLDVAKTLRLSSGYRITAAKENPAGELHREFIQYNFDNIRGGFKDDLRELMGAIESGWSLSEKVFETIEIGKWQGKIRLSALKSKRPKYYSLAVDEFDNLLPQGIVCISGNDFGKEYPSNKFIIYSLNKLYENLYGTSRLRSLYQLYFIKRVILRAWGIYLEKYGNPIAVSKRLKSGVDAATINADLEILKQLRLETAIAIPADVEIDIKEITYRGVDAFVNSINKIDDKIRRRILGELLDKNDSTGSYAKSAILQNTAMLFLEELGNDLADESINNQVIKQLIDINFGKQEFYPKFEFNSIMKKDRMNNIVNYYAGVANGSIHPQVDDEKLIREWLEFPELKVIPGRVEKPPVISPVQFKENIFTGVRRRTYTQFEEYIDFKEIESDIETNTTQTAAKISAILQLSTDDAIKQIEKYKIIENTNIADIERIQIKYLGDLKSAYNDYLSSIFNDGMRSARAEIKTRKLKKYAEVVDIRAVNPKQALEMFKVKAYTVAGKNKNVLTDIVRQNVTQTIQTKGDLSSCIKGIQNAMAGYLTIGAAFEDDEALAGYRLETTVRTILSDAYNYGRKTYFEDPINDGFVVAYQYSSVLDDRVRPNHAWMDGKIYTVTNPIWNTWYPPNGYNCRCIVVPVTKLDEWSESNEPPSSITPDAGFEKPGGGR